MATAFEEMGCEVEIEKKIALPRGEVEIDVFVVDSDTQPVSTYICECKHWNRRVSQDRVHAFRTVVSETGANRGILVSKSGYQRGAYASANFTNIDLLTWRKFEELFFDRWLHAVSSNLVPHFLSAYELMDPVSDDLWKGRTCTDELFQEWDHISRRYQLIIIWALHNLEYGLGIGSLSDFDLTDDGVLQLAEPVTLDTHRRIVTYAPAICDAARRELEDFWARVDSVSPT